MQIEEFGEESAVPAYLLSCSKDTPSSDQAARKALGPRNTSPLSSKAKVCDRWRAPITNVIQKQNWLWISDAFGSCACQLQVLCTDPWVSGQYTVYTVSKLWTYSQSQSRRNCPVTYKSKTIFVNNSRYTSWMASKPLVKLKRINLLHSGGMVLTLKLTLTGICSTCLHTSCLSPELAWS